MASNGVSAGATSKSGNVSASGRQLPVQISANEPVGISEDEFNELLHELNHDIWEVRRNAAEDLGNIADPRAVPYLTQRLSDAVGGVRFAVVEAIGKISDPRAVPALLQLLDDPTFGAFGPVIEALANMKSVEAIPYFIRFLRDEDQRIRGLAHNSLMVMTRQFIPFKAKGSEEERESAVQQWEAWWAQNYVTFQLPG
jgi:HEAT repeat protein